MWIHSDSAKKNTCTEAFTHFPSSQERLEMSGRHVSVYSRSVPVPSGRIWLRNDVHTLLTLRNKQQAMTNTRHISFLRQTIYSTMLWWLYKDNLFRAVITTIYNRVVMLTTTLNTDKYQWMATTALSRDNYCWIECHLRVIWHDILQIISAVPFYSEVVKIQ